ncbi:ABC-type Fe3+-hydroxamate transport system substrate-binding protein [Clostridium beijerinckii]|nr:ABC-type Fe3+-hydroxamate transport system substrate-binding protein [Clostridium beijerinckii]NRZ40890.1 ABC-type Fe3+-hydroxamate transport system substrate-binding protein [Clostridium beijerinckii]
MKKISVAKKLLAVCLTSMIFVGCTNTSNSTVKEENKTVKVTDVKGEIEIPANPQRIVDLSGKSDVLSILGYKVIGTANSDAYNYKNYLHI